MELEFGIKHVYCWWDQCWSLTLGSSSICFNHPWWMSALRRWNRKMSQVISTCKWDASPLTSTRRELRRRNSVVGRLDWQCTMDSTRNRCSKDNNKTLRELRTQEEKDRHVGVGIDRHTDTQIETQTHRQTNTHRVNHRRTLKKILKNENIKKIQTQTDRWMKWMDGLILR